VLVTSIIVTEFGDFAPAREDVEHIRGEWFDTLTSRMRYRKLAHLKHFAEILNVRNWVYCVEEGALGDD